MIRILATAILFAMPAHAQDAAFWGGTGCRLVPIEGQDWVAEIRCRNALTSGESYTQADLVSGDLTVSLSISHMPGDIPDRITVTPPDGYVALPPDMDVAEDGTGVIRVMPWVGF